MFSCTGAAFPAFGEASYFSSVSFTTVGYGDIVLGREWRQLASFEAVNRWIIFGWATALIVAIIQRLYSPPHAPRSCGRRSLGHLPRNEAAQQANLPPFV